MGGAGYWSNVYNRPNPTRIRPIWCDSAWQVGYGVPALVNSRLSVGTALVDALAPVMKDRVPVEQLKQE